MLACFPDLQPITRADRPAIEAITRRFPPYSDYSIGSLLCWMGDGEPRIATLEGNLVVRFTDYRSGAPIYSFLGDRRVVETAAALLAQANREGLEPALRLIGEAVIAGADLAAAGLRAHPDPDNHDYLLSPSEWAALAGGDYADLRAKVNRARRKASITVYPIDLGCPATRWAMCALYERWAAAKGRDEAELRPERDAFARLFAPGVAAGFAGCALVVEGCLVGFSVWEVEPNGTASIHHFMKCDPAIPGLAPLLIHERSRLLAAQGIACANIEQDLGIPGLREFKRSLQPCDSLCKYVITAAA